MPERTSPLAMKFYNTGNVLWIVSEAVALGIPALIVFSGLSLRMRNFAQRVGRRWFFVIAVYFILYSLLVYVLRFPLAFYAGFVRLHEYGLSKQTFAKWLYDSLVGQGVETALGAAVLWVPYWLIYRSPRRWWLYVGLLSLPMMFFVMLVEPIWVAPLFNRFGPMKDKQQEAEILALAHDAGIDGGRVFEVDMSADTNTVNAYVTGFAATKRIVLWDTLLQKLSPREVRVVMAHEMGHYVLDHVFWGIMAGCGGILFSLFLVNRLALLLLQRCKHLLGFDQLSDIASLPLMAALLIQATRSSSCPSALPSAVTLNTKPIASPWSLRTTTTPPPRPSSACKARTYRIHAPAGYLPYGGPVIRAWASASTLPTVTGLGNAARRCSMESYLMCLKLLDECILCHRNVRQIGRFHVIGIQKIANATVAIRYFHAFQIVGQMFIGQFRIRRNAGYGR